MIIVEDSRYRINFMSSKLVRIRLFVFTACNIVSAEEQFWNTAETISRPSTVLQYTKAL